jgi:hypothetical protein
MKSDQSLNWPSPAGWQSLLRDYAAELIREAHAEAREGVHILYKPKKGKAGVESESAKGK